MSSPSTPAPRVLLRSEQSRGRVSVIESTMPPGAAGPPLHSHEFDETFYVLEGELTFQLGDELVVAGAGDLAFAPGGIPHTLTNRSSTPASFLIVCTPARFERECHLAFAKATSSARCAGIRAPMTRARPLPGQQEGAYERHARPRRP